jgi:adenylate kinase
MPRIVFLGPASCGKSTQGAILTQRYRIPVISTGRLLRGRAEVNDEMGRKIGDMLVEGHCVSDDVVTDILRQRLMEADCQSGFVLDGFPRNGEQAMRLKNILGVQQLDAVIVLQLPREQVFQRVSGRFECSSCHTIYNKIFHPPQMKNVCDKCGSTHFLTRSDDVQTNTITRRLDIYEQMLSEIVAYYSEKNLIYFVNALKSIQEVSEEIEKILLKGFDINERKR